MYLGGKPLIELCAWLDEQGMPPRTIDHWTRSSLAKLFKNETPAGRRKDGAGRTQLRVPAILDRDTGQSLQDEMERKARRRGVAPRDTALLTGVHVCNHCSGPMYRHVGTRNGIERKHAYYRCFEGSGSC
jgi:hypothetical protein